MPTAETPPAVVTAGDSIDFAWSSADYPAPTWSTTWRVIGAAAGLPLALSSAADGSGFRVTATAAATAGITVPARGLPATLIGFASAGAERFEVWRAPLQLRPNPATITGDLRGHAAVTLAAIEALLEGKATKDQMSYRIGDRELSRIPIPELIQLRDYYVREKTREEDAAALAAGMPRRAPRVIHTRMARG
jgi:hypothetical protein